MVVVEQHGPTTGQFADYRKTQKMACVDISNALQEQTGMVKSEAHRLIISVGLPAIEHLRKCAEQAGQGDAKTVDLLIEACLTGFGWTGLASHYQLTDGYIEMIDGLNSLNIKTDNDLPPTEEKT